MSIINVDLDGVYIPKTEDQDIRVAVQIGDGQTGAYVIFLGRELKGTNTEAILGTKANVAGKTTIVVATIIDTLEETNWTSITIQISEGIFIQMFGPYTKQVPENFDTVIYTLKIMH